MMQKFRTFFYKRITTFSRAAKVPKTGRFEVIVCPAFEPLIDLLLKQTCCQSGNILFKNLFTFVYQAIHNKYRSYAISRPPEHLTFKKNYTADAI
jgi:hypothetical protein